MVLDNIDLEPSEKLGGIGKNEALPATATIEDMKAQRLVVRTQLVMRLCMQVLWCRKTCLQHTGDIFCQVERLRVQKAGTPMLNWVVRHLVSMSYQDRPLLPLLMASNCFTTGLRAPTLGRVACDLAGIGQTKSVKAVGPNLGCLFPRISNPRTCSCFVRPPNTSMLCESLPLSPVLPKTPTPPPPPPDNRRST